MKCEIVAEISGNHGGDICNAINLITQAQLAGADTVKFQCFEPERLAKKRLGIMWHGCPQTYMQLFNIYAKTHTPKGWFPRLIERCFELHMPWFSSVFDPADVLFLESVDCPRYKISAYEMLDGDLINAVKATGKPIVMSVRPTFNLTILRATDYDGFLQPLGLSDHGPAWSAHRGPMVERHIRLEHVETADSAFSSTPQAFSEYVKAIRRLG